MSRRYSVFAARAMASRPTWSCPRAASRIRRCRSPPRQHLVVVRLICLGQRLFGVSDAGTHLLLVAHEDLDRPVGDRRPPRRRHERQTGRVFEQLQPVGVRRGDVQRDRDRVAATLTGLDLDVTHPFDIRSFVDRRFTGIWHRATLASQFRSPYSRVDGPHSLPAMVPSSTSNFSGFDLLLRGVEVVEQCRCMPSTGKLLAT